MNGADFDSPVQFVRGIRVTNTGRFSSQCFGFICIRESILKLLVFFHLVVMLSTASWTVTRIK